MKTNYARRYRRSSSSSSRDSAISKKDNQQEHAFFAAPSKESFFKPNTNIQRNCAHCEAEENKVNRMSVPEEEKRLHKKEQEKELHRQINDTEEEKKVQKMEDEKEQEKKVNLKPEPEEKEKMMQRKPDVGEEEKKLQKMTDKKEETELQRLSENKEEDKRIAKKESNASANTFNSVSSYIHSLDGKGQALSKEAQHFFGERMGYDFSEVRIHTGPEAEQSAKAVNAKAYTVDNHLVFNKGQYNPSSEEGKKLLAHELTHVVQNNNGTFVAKKAQNTEKEKEESITITGSGSNAKSKSAYGNCEGVQVQGQTDFNPLPSSFNVKGGTTRPATTCEACTAPDCITARGTIVSRFSSNITVTLPSVPDGLTPCETVAVRRFINTTLRQHEQQHVAAFSRYNGMVRTPFTFTGCRSDLEAHIQSIHDGIDAQRSADAIAQSNALDSPPFVRSITCDCE